jgi:hypothetical protein
MKASSHSHTDPEAWPRLRGAITLVAQNHFIAPQIIWGFPLLK